MFDVPIWKLVVKSERVGAWARSQQVAYRTFQNREEIAGQNVKYDKNCNIFLAILATCNSLCFLCLLKF